MMRRAMAMLCVSIALSGPAKAGCFLFIFCDSGRPSHHVHHHVHRHHVHDVHRRVIIVHDRSKASTSSPMRRPIAPLS